MAPKRHRSGIPASAAGKLGEGGSIDELKLRNVGSEVRFFISAYTKGGLRIFIFISPHFLELLMCKN